jgi:hypothetical protein
MCEYDQGWDFDIKQVKNRFIQNVELGAPKALILELLESLKDLYESSKTYEDQNGDKIRSKHII